MHLTRWAAVPLTTALLGLTTFLGAAPAEAASTCTQPMTLPPGGTVAGYLDEYSSGDYWRYNAAGTTTVAIVGVDVAITVYTGCSSSLCSSATTCSVTWTGPVIILAQITQSAPSPYVLTVASTGTSPSCNRVSTSGFCVHLTNGTLVEQQTVFSVTRTPAPTQTVGGWIDAYRFALPTGGSAVVPCVVLAVNDTTANPCATAGGTFVSRAMTLVEDTPLATVRVCNATLTVTAGGFGLENIPIYSIC